MRSVQSNRADRRHFDFEVSRGERAGIRTLDLLIKSQLLYRLSYALPRGEKRPWKVRGTYAGAYFRSTEK